jgi:hypothetical protein
MVIPEAPKKVHGRPPAPGRYAPRALRTDRQSAERVAAQRFLRVVAAEARRLSGQLRLPGLLSGIEAQSLPTERRGVESGASPSTRASI